MADDAIDRRVEIKEGGTLSFQDPNLASESTQKRIFNRMVGARRMAVIGAGNQNNQNPPAINNGNIENNDDDGGHRMGGGGGGNDNNERELPREEASEANLRATLAEIEAMKAERIADAELERQENEARKILREQQRKVDEARTAKKEALEAAYEKKIAKYAALEEAARIEEAARTKAAAAAAATAALKDDTRNEIHHGNENEQQEEISSTAEDEHTEEGKSSEAISEKNVKRKRNDDDEEEEEEVDKNNTKQIKINKIHNDDEQDGQQNNDNQLSEGEVEKGETESLFVNRGNDEDDDMGGGGDDQDSTRNDDENDALSDGLLLQLYYLLNFFNGPMGCLAELTGNDSLHCDLSDVVVPLLLALGDFLRRWTKKNEIESDESMIQASASTILQSFGTIIRKMNEDGEVVEVIDLEENDVASVLRNIRIIYRILLRVLSCTTHGKARAENVFNFDEKKYSFFDGLAEQNYEGHYDKIETVFVIPKSINNIKDVDTTYEENGRNCKLKSILFHFPPNNEQEVVSYKNKDMLTILDLDNDIQIWTENDNGVPLMAVYELMEEETNDEEEGERERQKAEEKAAAAAEAARLVRVAEAEEAARLAAVEEKEQEGDKARDDKGKNGEDDTESDTGISGDDDADSEEVDEQSTVDDSARAQGPSSKLLNASVIFLNNPLRHLTLLGNLKKRMLPLHSKDPKNVKIVHAMGALAKNLLNKNCDAAGKEASSMKTLEFLKERINFTKKENDVLTARNDAREIVETIIDVLRNTTCSPGSKPLPLALHKHQLIGKLRDGLDCNPADSHNIKNLLLIQEQSEYKAIPYPIVRHDRLAFELDGIVLRMDDGRYVIILNTKGNTHLRGKHKSYSLLYTPVVFKNLEEIEEYIDTQKEDGKKDCDIIMVLFTKTKKAFVGAVTTRSQAAKAKRESTTTRVDSPGTGPEYCVPTTVRILLDYNITLEEVMERIGPSDDRDHHSFDSTQNILEKYEIELKALTFREGDHVGFFSQATTGTYVIITTFHDEGGRTDKAYSELYQHVFVYFADKRKVVDGRGEFTLPKGVENDKEEIHKLFEKEWGNTRYKFTNMYYVCSDGKVPPEVRPLLK